MTAQRRVRNGLKAARRRLLHYLIAIPLIAPFSATVMLLDGPVWDSVRLASPASPDLAALERRYAARTGDAPLIIADTPSLVTAHGTDYATLGPQIRRHVSARLNARGWFANLLWQREAAPMSTPTHSPFAQHIWFAGGPHGDGLSGYFGLTQATVVVPPSPAITTTEIEHGYIGYPMPLSAPRANGDWYQMINFHELEHAVDAAQHRSLGIALLDGARRHLAGTWVDPVLPAPTWPGPAGAAAAEIFADLGAAVQMLRAHPPERARPLIERMARLRALGPMWSLARGAEPYLGHFTSPALFDLLRATRERAAPPLRLDGAALTRALDSQRKAQMRRLTAVDWDAVIAETAGNPRDLAEIPALLARHGMPKRWVRDLKSAISWYRRQLTCYTQSHEEAQVDGLIERVRHGGAVRQSPARASSLIDAPAPERQLRCRHLRADGRAVWRTVPPRLAGQSPASDRI